MAAIAELQQYLPFTVLKRTTSSIPATITSLFVATVLTVYGIETANARRLNCSRSSGCNSTYRLRY